MISCNSFFTDITWKFHIHISLLIAEIIMLNLQPRRKLSLLIWIILLVHSDNYNKEHI